MFENLSVDKNRCFMIMPFSDEYLEVYAVIKEELGNIGIMCNRVDEIKGSKPIMNKIITEILKSRYIIADLSECNANVFYELGIAHSFRDSRNILLLKQKDSKYPFDLSHLPYIEYKKNNPIGLKVIVKKFIDESRYAADFADALFSHGISINSRNGRSNYVEYVQDRFEAQVDTFTEILNESGKKPSEESIMSILSDYESFIGGALSDQSEEILTGILKIYSLLLSCCPYENITRKYVSRFFEYVLPMDDRYEGQHLAWKTDMMLSLARRGRVLDICMPWIIEYFSRSKSSNIDLNRYKLEKFLVETDNEKINDMIIEAIYDDNCYVREHMSDIIGCKDLTRGYKTLINQLNVEENYYTIGSIVEAIGRVAPADAGMSAIEEWIANSGKMVIVDNQIFLLKHLYNAIARLDTEGHPHLNNFMREYGDKMQTDKFGTINTPS